MLYTEKALENMLIIDERVRLRQSCRTIAGGGGLAGGGGGKLTNLIGSHIPQGTHSTSSDSYPPFQSA